MQLFASAMRSKLPFLSSLNVTAVFSFFFVFINVCVVSLYPTSNYAMSKVEYVYFLSKIPTNSHKLNHNCSSILQLQSVNHICTINSLVPRPSIWYIDQKESGNETSLVCCVGHLASFPGSPGMRIFIARRAWYLSYVSMTSQNRTKQKGNILRVFQPTVLQRSVCVIQRPIARYVQ